MKGKKKERRFIFIVSKFGIYSANTTAVGSGEAEHHGGRSVWHRSLIF